ncbi:unnamed protein product [Parajaminaea phylloscopi]
MAPRTGSSLPLARHHRIYLGLFAGIVAVFTLLSVVFQTHAYNVLANQGPPVPGLRPVASVFARKSNPINRIFIKKAWLWTTLADLALIFTLRSPAPSLGVSAAAGKQRQQSSSRLNGSADGASPGDAAGQVWTEEARPEDQEATVASPLAKSILRWSIATLCWLSFAVWLFGPSIMQRILTSSGGVCVPRDDFTSVGRAGDTFPLPLPETRIDDAFCRAGSRGISKEERPELFRTAHAIVSDRSAGGKLRGSWKGGHDASGHVFILILSSLLLLEEFTPYLSHFGQAVLPAGLSSTVTSIVPASVRATRNPYRGQQRTASLAASVTALALVGLWTFSLVNTSLFFHTPAEKVSGALMAFVSWALLPKGG